jgi:hypothetical protein
MLKASWHASYPNEPFPEEIISSNESSSRDAIVSDSSDDSNSDTDTEKTTNPPKKSGRYRVKDVTLPNGYIVKDVPNNYMVISTSELSFYKYERAIVSAMVKMFKRKQADPTFYSQRLFGAYAASNPTIPTACQEIMIYTARHTMMHDVASLLSDPKHQAKFSKLFLSVDNVCNLSPSARTLDHYVDDLAVMQAMIASHAISKAKHVFLQSDAGPDGSVVKLFTFWDSSDKTATDLGSIQQFYAGLESSGKKGVDTAKGIDYTLQYIWFECRSFQISRYRRRFRGGTQESQLAELVSIGCVLETARAESCGLHDNQSVF